MAGTVQAQLYQTQYRVPGQRWMEINTEQFRIIFPQRYESEALRSLAILESEYEHVQTLVGGSIRNFPFIINPENDRSNGFVSPLNFRSEIELSPVLGKTMNPRSGDWLEMVLPHELVHALHFNVNTRSFTRLLGLFSPDVRRSVHSAAPLGVFEGIAVHHESHSAITGAGRGHHPFFRNQFNAHLNTRQEWSMGQLLHVTDFTPPFDRHYIGGYEFSNWLLTVYGEDTVKQAIDFHYKWPFLGFGTALRRATGYWPAQLYRSFSSEKKTVEEQRIGQSGRDTDSLSEEMKFRAGCKRLNRPQWLDNKTIVFFARSCNRTAGFYSYQTESRRSELLHEISITPDFVYSLNPNEQTLTYSRYHTDTLYDNLFKGDLHKLDLSTGRPERLTRSQRLFSPDVIDKEIYALQTAANEMELVALNKENGEIIRRFSKPDNSSVVQVAMNPHRGYQAAVIGRKQSVQAIWFEYLDEDDELFTSDPVIVFQNGSVYDISWHPSEEKFLFVSDHSGIMNVYEYNAGTSEVRRITESLYNAFEASYSPDGQFIAYVRQEINEQKIYVLDLKDAVNQALPESDWMMNEKVDQDFERPLMNRQFDFEADGWLAEPYRTGASWVKPRFWAPEFEQEAGFDRIGINFESVDVMSSQSYSVDVNNYADRFWGNLTYTNKQFFPGFRLEAFNNPIWAAFRVENEEENGDDQIISLLQQSRGGSLKIPVRFRLESNVRFSSFLIEPQYFIAQIRFLDPFQSSAAVSEFGTRHTVGLRSVLNYRIRQFFRDVQPNSGVALFAEGRYGLNSDQIGIESGMLSTIGNLARRKGLRAGVITYLAPLSGWNQSLRVFAQVYSQTTVPVFNVLSQYSDNFSEIPLVGANNVGILNNRYTIPLIYPDDGGIFLPAYLSNIYLVLFSQTVTDLNHQDLLAASRSVFGLGIRSRFRLSNLAFDVGISIGWEPTRNEFTTFVGTF